MCCSLIIIVVNSYLSLACLTFSNRDLKNIHIPKDNHDHVSNKKAIVVPMRRRLVILCRPRMPKVYCLSLHGVWFPPLTC